MKLFHSGERREREFCRPFVVVCGGVKALPGNSRSFKFEMLLFNAKSKLNCCGCVLQGPYTAPFCDQPAVQRRGLAATLHSVLQSRHVLPVVLPAFQNSQAARLRSVLEPLLVKWAQNPECLDSEAYQATLTDIGLRLFLFNLLLVASPLLLELCGILIFFVSSACCVTPFFGADCQLGTRYKVDLYLSSQVHVYERTFRVLNGSVCPAPSTDVAASQWACTAFCQSCAFSFS